MGESKKKQEWSAFHRVPKPGALLHIHLMHLANQRAIERERGAQR